MLIYDIEIINAIPPKDPADRIDGIKYCAGWHDFEHMGIAVVGAYDYVEDAYRVFCGDNLTDFWGLAMDQDCLVGFNSISFDNKLLAVEGFDFDKLPCFDILREVWAGAGLAAEFDPASHKGFGLDAMARANTGHCKSGSGADAPIQWQRGQIGVVIDYCLCDVWLTKQLMDRILIPAPLRSPRDNSWIDVRWPVGLDP